MGTALTASTCDTTRRSQGLASGHGDDCFLECERLLAHFERVLIAPVRGGVMGSELAHQILGGRFLCFPLRKRANRKQVSKVGEPGGAGARFFSPAVSGKTIGRGFALCRIQRELCNQCEGSEHGYYHTGNLYRTSTWVKCGNALSKGLPRSLTFPETPRLFRKPGKYLFAPTTVADEARSATTPASIPSLT